MIKWLKSTKATIAARIHRILKGMCEVILPLSRSAVWKGDKVHYAHLHLAPSSPEIWENKITQHLRLWHSTKSTCARIYSSIYSQMPFPKGQKGIFIFCPCGCVSVSVFSQRWWESTNLAVIEGRVRVQLLQLKRLDGHFPSVVQRLCLPQFSLSFMSSCFR